ncbi:MAG: TIGR01777 family oxidoreductase [Chthoniobacterales bacterium]
MKNTIIIAGGSGFIGEALQEKFRAENFAVVVLTRGQSSERAQVRFVHWDGKTLGPWTKELENAQALVNLTGKSINCRHTAENKSEILSSRVDSVRVLGQAIQECANPPKVFLQVSAVGIYGNSGDRICAENTPHGSDFVAEVCAKWEEAFHEIDSRHLRKVLFRLGIVLAPNGGMLRVLARLTRAFLGGRAGSGRQFISWIELAEVAAIFAHAVAHDKMQGAFNLAAPNPVTNAEFMKILRGVLHRPWSPPVPAPAVKLGSFVLGTEGSLALEGQRAVPVRLREVGYEFLSPKLRPVLEKMFRA